MLKIHNGCSVEYTAIKSIKDLIFRVQSGGIGYLAVLNTEGRLIGIVTDADIRHAILHDKLTIDSLINRKPRVATQNESPEQVKAILKRVKRRHMPVVTHMGEYLGVYSLDLEEFDRRDNWVVIMAGGLGARLGSLTRETPKPMLEVGGVPILKRIIDNFISNGFYKFILSVNYKKEVIKDYFGDGGGLGVTIQYLEESQRLGTAGALSLIDFPLKYPIVVVNGDVLAVVDYEEMLEHFECTQSNALMGVREYSHQIPYGVVNVDGNEGDILGFEEKPTMKYLINAGVYVLSEDALACIPYDQYFEMPDLFMKLSGNGFRCTSRKINGYWVDIGKVDDFYRADRDFKGTENQ